MRIKMIEMYLKEKVERERRGDCCKESQVHKQTYTHRELHHPEVREM